MIIHHIDDNIIRVDWGRNPWSGQSNKRKFELLITKEIGLLNKQWKSYRVIDNEWAHTYAVDYHFNNPSYLSLILLKYKYDPSHETV